MTEVAPNQVGEAPEPDTDVSTAPSRIFPTSSVSSLIRRLTRPTIIASLISPARAFNAATCCMTRARQFIVEYDDSPWTVCAAGVSEPWNRDPPFPRVQANLAWCLEHCPGFAANGLEEWLHPLAQWFVPYATLLFLCPIGDSEEEAVEMGIIQMVLDYVSKKIFAVPGWNEAIPEDRADDLLKQHDFTKRLLEWLNILGDPASAVWGSIAQLNMDWWIIQRLKNLGNTGVDRHSTGDEVADWYDKEMLGVVVMAGQTAMNKDLGTALTKQLIFEALVTAVDVLTSRDGNNSAPSPTSLNRTLVDLKKALLESKDNTQFLENVDDEATLRELSLLARYLMHGNIDPSNFLNTAFGRIGTSGSHTTLGNAIETAFQALEGINRDSTMSRRAPTPSTYFDSSFSIKIRKAIRTILEARRTFITAIALPVVVHFATTAQIFYESYQKMGDSSTAHGLAYGAMFSWLLLIAVIDNCAVASANASLITQQIKGVFRLSQIRVPLRERYSNALEWECWLTDIGLDTGLKNRVVAARSHQPTLDTRAIAFKWFYAKYLVGQLVGWVTVAFFCGCAAIISYTTPTVGWGCRSFNHLMYAVFSLVVALLQVAKHKARRIDEQNHLNAPKTTGKSAEEGGAILEVSKVSGDTHPSEKVQAEITPVVNPVPEANANTTPPSRTSPPHWRTRRQYPKPACSPLTKIIRALYIIFAILNFAILIVGTILNWAGVYNSCRCKHIFGPSDYPLELGSNTQLALDMAKKYWNSTGYVAYLVAWCVCAIAVVARKVLQGRMALEFMEE